MHAHKKFKAHSTSWVVIIHAIGGFVETVLMFVYFLNPHSTSSQLYGLAASWTALIIHIPAGFMLTPRVWGLKNITVGGYLFVGLCQLQKALDVVSNSYEVNISSLSELWILLHTATLVRLVLYHITPYSSIDGIRRGDLFTEPLVYTLGVSLATLVTLAFVYPPELFLLLYLIFAIIEKLNPSKMRSGLLPKVIELKREQDDKIKIKSSVSSVQKIKADTASASTNISGYSSKLKSKSDSDRRSRSRSSASRSRNRRRCRE